MAGIVAALRPEKNHEMFLRAAETVRREVPNARFLVVGDGPDRARLEDLAGRLSLGDPSGSSAREATCLSCSR